MFEGDVTKVGTYLDLDLPVSFVAMDDELLLSRTIVHEEQRGVCGSMVVSGHASRGYF